MCVALVIISALHKKASKPAELFAGRLDPMIRIGTWNQPYRVEFAVVGTLLPWQ